ncbi:IclR family transcriptional regulator [Homoserinimonas sp. A447]
MSTAVPRSFAVLELLVGKPDGLQLGEIAEALELPKSAAHRVLAELVALGYVNQENADGRYALGLRLISQAVRHLARIPLVELAKPLLDRLAEVSGELARLGLPDHGSLIWVAKTQGARSGLRYDADAGREVKLVRTSSGMAWLSTMSDVVASALLAAQGFDDLENFGPDGPTDLESALELLNQVRADGYCYTDSTFELGTATIAVPISSEGTVAAGVLSISGPSVRLTQERGLALVPHLREAAAQLSIFSVDSGREPQKASVS